MKKTAIAAALALSLGASLAHAQASDPRGWYAGIDVGARQWFLKAGWDHYTKVGGSQTGEDSLNTYSLGVGYRF